MYGQGRLVLKEGQAVAEYGWLAENGGLDPCSSPGIKSRYNGMDACRSFFIIHSKNRHNCIVSFLSYGYSEVTQRVASLSSEPEKPRLD